VSSAILPAVIRRFTQENPRALLDVETTAVTTALPKLRDRSLDLVMILGAITLEDIHLASDLKVEVLFNDELVVAADAHSQWARRRKIDLVELADARWILAPSGFSNVLLAQAFRARGLDLPKISLKTFSIHIRANLIAGTSFVTTLPKSVLNYYADQLPLKALPVALPARPWPLLVVTLKDRSVSPVVERFVQCARQVTKSMSS
jgi:DNA-binding transcriptional LysR family regulator